MNERGVSEEIFSYDRNLGSSLPAGLPAVMVDDVVTTNGTLERAATALKDGGIEVLAAVCVLDRRPLNVRDETAFPVHALATLTEALLFGLEHGHVEPTSVPSIQAELRMLGAR